MKIKPTNIEVKLEPKDWLWMAIDENGMMFVSTILPRTGRESWDIETNDQYQDLEKVEFKGDWKESLTRFDINILKNIFNIVE